VITVSIKHFVDALANAPVFVPPVLDGGVQYIQDKICNRLINGEPVSFSEIDFNAFSLDDFDALRDIQSEAEHREHKSTEVAHSLYRIKPATLASTFI